MNSPTAAPTTLTKDRVLELLADARRRKAQDAVTSSAANAAVLIAPDASTAARTDTVALTALEALAIDPLHHILHSATGRSGEQISYNSKQEQFIRLVASGKSCVLLGAAGTGKTTSVQGAIRALIASGRLGSISKTDVHKYLVPGTPGITIIAYTRRATANIRKVMPEDVKSNCITHHKLMEYAPVYFEVEDEKTGAIRTTMKFEATRNRLNPQPEGITVCFIEEGSMYSTEFYEELRQTLPANTQYIFLGDIQQLPPVFGSAILGFKILELPTVELTEVYRQALESPIIRLAHRILEGKVITDAEFSGWRYKDQLYVHPFSKRMSEDVAVATLAKLFTITPTEAAAVTSLPKEMLHWFTSYDPMKDMILLPFNKGVGTIELNKCIANKRARRAGLETYEVIAGYNKHYFSLGDKVLVDKEDAIIIEIKRNQTYLGASPQASSKSLDYWGYNDGGNHHGADAGLPTDVDDMELLLSQVSAADSEDRVTAASHLVTVEFQEGGERLTLEKAAEVNLMLLGYALTVHKAQGSEWERVFLVLHHTHNTMLARELLYTGVTRAKKGLMILCEKNSLEKGIKAQRIQGNTLAEKAEFFRGKRDSKAALTGA